MSRRRPNTKESGLEATLAMQIRAAKLPAPERNYRFCAAHVGGGNGLRERLRAAGLNDYEFDFAWPGEVIAWDRMKREYRLAIEIDGLKPGGKSGHQTIQGALRDREKWMQGVGLGWLCFSVTGPQIKSGAALQLIDRLLA